MARITITPLHGRLSNVIVYEYRGTPCMRAKPIRVRQTKATKESAKVFGRSAVIAKWLRYGLQNLPAYNNNHRARYNIDNAVLQWIRAGKPTVNKAGYAEPAWEALTNVRFNERIELDSRMRQPITVDWSNPKEAILQMPAIDTHNDMRAPAHTKVLHWMVAITGTTVEDPYTTHMYQVQFDIPFADHIPALQVPLKCNIVPDSLNIVAVSLCFSVMYKGDLKMRQEAPWTPAGIVAAHYEA